MAYTEADRLALQQAIASGVLRTTYDGRSVEFRSMAELREALAQVEASLTAAAGEAPVRQVRFYADGKGL